MAITAQYSCVETTAWFRLATSQPGQSVRQLYLRYRNNQKFPATKYLSILPPRVDSSESLVYCDHSKVGMRAVEL